jgi:carboxylesterase type B
LLFNETNVDRLRYNISALTFRYFNTANFSNISPRPWEGAYHTSELPLIFGTYSLYTSGNDTTRPPAEAAFEAAVSSHWQDLYLAFIRDPVNGLPAMGWPAFQPKGGNKTVMMFGGNGSEVVSELISNEYLTAPCMGIAESYN